jgi:predicted dehydrogenase
MLDLLDFFFGPIAKVQAFAANQGRQYRAEDIVSGAFVFDSGVHGTGSWCFTGFESEDVTEIVGSLGKIRYATFENEPVVLTTKEGRTEFSFPDLAHIQQPLIQTVVDDLLGKGSCLSTGESAARTSWVIDQMLAGYF